ncbi:MAG: (d)CMP kinase [bacterium]|nr:(d)CMP kinase [bacterium]MYD05088.1 (d)CMP kinase [Acidimicrobiia bacterium]
MTAPTWERWVVAIDGPGGVGKSTVARGVAQALGYESLDSGAFYRAATLLIKLHRIDPEDEAAVMVTLAGADLAYRDGTIFLEGVDVGRAIRTVAITTATSPLAALPGVRLLVVKRLRRWVAEREGRVVVEGRDMGTVVFPASELKIYLDADPEIRAARRAGETRATVREVAARLKNRDRQDSTRTLSPLAAADDAHRIDTTTLNADQVIARVLSFRAG